MRNFIMATVGDRGVEVSKATDLIVVRLDNPKYGAGPATVIARVADVADFILLATDRDGARDPALRLWRGVFVVGARVHSLCSPVALPID